MLARDVTGEQRRDPRGTSFFRSLEFMCYLSSTVTSTGNQDHLVFIKGLGTQARGLEGALGFSLISRLFWPPCLCTLLSILEGPLIFFPPGDFLLKFTGTNSERPQMEFSDPSVQRSQPLNCDEPAPPPASPLG